MTMDWCESRLARPMPVGLTRVVSHRLLEALTAAGTVMTVDVPAAVRACGIHQDTHTAQSHPVGGRPRVKPVTMFVGHRAGPR